jgi:hypothetical protein
VKYRFSPLAGRRVLHSDSMLQLLGVKKLPVLGMPVTLLPGIDSTGKPVQISVWVAPFVPKFRPGWNGAPKRVKSSTHRVRCKCPGCGVELSAGRLFQHVCEPPLKTPVAFGDQHGLTL